MCTIYAFSKCQMNEVISLKHKSAWKLAIHLSTSRNFKNDVFSDSVTAFTPTRIFSCVVLSTFKRLLRSSKNFKDLPKCLQNTIASFVEEVAINILQWCRYQEAKFHLPHCYTICFLTESMFTAQGDIHDDKVIDDIVNDNTLSNCQRYQVACGYFRTNKIDDFWLQMSVDERNSFLFKGNAEESNCSQLPMLWAHRLMDKLHELPLEPRVIAAACGQPVEEAFQRFAFEQCVVDRNPTGVRMAWDQLSIGDQETFAGQMAMKVCDQVRDRRIGNVTFIDRRMADILCFLMSKMTDSVQKEFLKEDFLAQQYSRVLYQLIWCGYNHVVLRTLALMWDFLPLKEYDRRLSQIYGNISCLKRQLFEDVWNHSPEDIRKAVLKDGEFLRSSIIHDWNKFEEVKFILQVLTAKERVSVVFSKFKEDICEPGLFLMAFAAGYLKFAKWLVTSCQLSESILKHRVKIELDHIEFEMTSEDKTAHHLVVNKKMSCLDADEVKWTKKRWNRLLIAMQTKEGLEEYEKFFLWSFLSQQDIIDYKKKLFHSIFFSDVYYNMILGSLGFQLPVHEFYETEDPLQKFTEPFPTSVERLLSFFNINEVQKRELDTETMLRFSNSEIMEELFFYASANRYNESFNEFIGRVHKLLKWCLHDKEMVEEFREKFKQTCIERWQVKPDNDVCKELEIAFQQRLQDIDDGQNSFTFVYH